MSVLQRGHSGDGCDLVSTSCKYVVKAKFEAYFDHKKLFEKLLTAFQSLVQKDLDSVLHLENYVFIVVSQIIFNRIVDQGKM